MCTWQWAVSQCLPFVEQTAGHTILLLLKDTRKAVRLLNVMDIYVGGWVALVVGWEFAKPNRGHGGNTGLEVGKRQCI